MKIIVTGAHGFLGRYLLGLGSQHERIGWSRASGSVEGVFCHQVDLFDRGALTGLLDDIRPDWVINTAAITDVDGCELDPDAARTVNVDMVANLVAACDATGVGLAHISTDYVFDGTCGPYGEGDDTAPLSRYGALKLESEHLVLDGLARGMVVRTMWLYGYVAGARPNMITWPLSTLARGDALEIVADQWGNPTYGPDLAHALVELCAGEATGLWHVGGGSFMTRYVQVVERASFFHLDAARIGQTTTAALAQPASRPLRSGLCTEAVEKQLGWKPTTFVQSLEDLLRDERFRQDHAYLFESRKL